LPRRADASGDEVYLYFSCSATPACERMAAHFGDIHYEGVAIYDPRRDAIDFHGRIHRFPAFEMYASVNEGQAAAVFRVSPPRGSDAIHRVGAGTRPVKAAVALA
jgi:hypothetical protein